mmetsp:Transcript_36854/g.80641  ORF Transcript_36854/g.80641 Transcript_36854/m.80641 type:complete len:232 (-) Transcript_36854:61-756(-)
MPYLIFIVKRPCCPHSTSFKKVNSPSQTMGVISTPNAGGTAPLMSRKRGSVGQTARKKGKSLTLVVGYHEITTLHSMANENRLRNGPRMLNRGWTHGSVSARRSEADPAAAIISAEADDVAALKSPAMVPIVLAAASVAGMNSANADGSNGSMFSAVFLPICTVREVDDMGTEDGMVRLVVGDGGTNALTNAGDDSGARKTAIIIRHASQTNFVPKALVVGGRGIMIAEKF